jgi:hypothetical protein
VLWHWSGIAEWLVDAGLLDSERLDKHQWIIDAVNAMLDARRVVNGRSAEDQAAIRRLVA